MRQIIKQLSGKKNGTSQNFSVLSHDVTRLGFEPSTATIQKTIAEFFQQMFKTRCLVSAAAELNDHIGCEKYTPVAVGLATHVTVPNEINSECLGGNGFF